MLKVAILDDYQNVSQEFVDLKKLSEKYEFKIFSEPFLDEADAIEQLADFEALLIMRERTPVTKNLRCGSGRYSRHGDFVLVRPTGGTAQYPTHPDLGHEFPAAACGSAGT